MRLYMVEPAEHMGSPMFYWAENEEQAIDGHRKQTGTGDKLMASAVWANNRDKAYRGYVVQD